MNRLGSAWSLRICISNSLPGQAFQHSVRNVLLHSLFTSCTCFDIEDSHHPLLSEESRVLTSIYCMTPFEGGGISVCQEKEKTAL